MHITETVNAYRFASGGEPFQAFGLPDTSPWQESQGKEKPTHLQHPESRFLNLNNLGTPDRIRTCDLLLRRQALYPAELRAHNACQ